LDAAPRPPPAAPRLLPLLLVLALPAAMPPKAMPPKAMPPAAGSDGACVARAAVGVRAGDHGGDAGSTAEGEKGDGGGSPGGGPLSKTMARPTISRGAWLEVALSKRARIWRLVPVLATPAALAARLTAAIESSSPTTEEPMAATVVAKRGS